MKKIIVYAICNISILFVITLLLSGFKVPGGIVAYLFLALALALINWGVKPIIRFLTLPINFVTLALFNLILSFALLYFVKFIIPGFSITSGEFLGLSSPYFTIPKIKADVVATILIASLIFSLFSALVDWLLRSLSKSSD